MKKSFTLTYEQIRQKQLKQSRVLIVVGVILVAVAVFGFTVFASGLRDKLYTRQLLISLAQNNYSTAINTDGGGANAAGEDARAYLLNTVESAASKRIALLSNKIGSADSGENAADALASDASDVNAQIVQWNAQLTFVTEHIRTTMDDAANERIKKEITEANTEATAAREQYSAAAAESRSAGNKVTKAKGKLGRGSITQQEYDELVNAQTEADALKNAAYETQTAALERLNSAYLSALEYEGPFRLVAVRDRK